MKNEKETALAPKIVDDRNLTVHAYDEELAQQIYRRIKEKHCPFLKALAERIAERVKA